MNDYPECLNPDSLDLGVNMIARKDVEKSGKSFNLVNLIGFKFKFFGNIKHIFIKGIKNNILLPAVFFKVKSGSNMYCIQTFASGYHNSKPVCSNFVVTSLKIYNSLRFCRQFGLSATSCQNHFARCSFLCKPFLEGRFGSFCLLDRSFNFCSHSFNSCRLHKKSFSRGYMSNIENCPNHDSLDLGINMIAGKDAEKSGKSFNRSSDRRKYFQEVA